jgi:1,4-alpha-glucan branching enzyme
MVTVRQDTVEFEFLRPQAREVHLVGDFNGWSKGLLPMVKTLGGFWRARLRLPGGSFRFRYCADGEWFTDFAAFGIEPGPYGPVSVVYVPVRQDL